MVGKKRQDDAVDLVSSCLASTTPAPSKVVYKQPRKASDIIIQQCLSDCHHSHPASSPSHHIFSAPKSSWNANPWSRIGVCPVSLSLALADRVSGAYYAAQLGISLKAQDPNSRNLLLNLLDALERLKKEIGPNDTIDNEPASAAYVENFALKVFKTADDEDRAGNATRYLLVLRCAIQLRLI